MRAFGEPARVNDNYNPVLDTGITAGAQVAARMLELNLSVDGVKDP